MIDSLLASREVVICAGAGGVGKTTIAAALGLEAALNLGGRVLVLTVDPARRLASALGLTERGNAEAEIDLSALGGPAIGPRGSHHAAMLDTKASWDDLVREGLWRG